MVTSPPACAMRQAAQAPTSPAPITRNRRLTTSLPMSPGAPSAPRLTVPLVRLGGRGCSAEPEELELCVAYFRPSALLPSGVNPRSIVCQRHMGTASVGPAIDLQELSSSPRRPIRREKRYRFGNVLGPTGAAERDRLQHGLDVRVDR